MIFITSGAYLGSEFTSLFGLLPPSFLPVGNRRLFHWQALSFAGLSEKIVLTLPHDFVIQDSDREELDKLGIEVLRLPDNLSLGEAIVHAIKAYSAVNEPVRILHGDTLCGQLVEVDLDVVLIGTTSDHYRWAQCESDENGNLRLNETLLSESKASHRVLCGYFTFSNGGSLAKCLAAASNDFVGGLNLYAQEFSLSALDSPDWLDFGHVHTYYRSKARFSTERAFNSLAATPLWIRKSSIDQAKIKAEAHWYESLTPELAIYTPRYLGQEVDPSLGTSYRLEYLYLSTLSELALFGDLPSYSWQRIFSCLDEFMSRMHSVPAPSEHARATSATYRDKTLARLTDFAQEEGLDISAPTKFDGYSLPSLERITEAVCLEIPDALAADTTVMHGDLCYSNILFDPRSIQVRMIDPRGRTLDGQVSVYGDSRYDLAKLSHSVVGKYDSIIAGRYKIRRNGPLDYDLELPQQGNANDIELQFKNMTFAGRSPNECWVDAMMITLFLSMLPLHYDNKNRQYALLANALRLFKKI
jgi:aminoglycoside phosphotransferase (APT) family kinase protein